MNRLNSVNSWLYTIKIHSARLWRAESNHLRGKPISVGYFVFQNILIDDLPAIFLYSPDYTYPVNKKIKGLDVERIALPADRFINIENWYLKTKKQFFK